jgi:hypothetical protein
MFGSATGPAKFSSLFDPATNKMRGDRKRPDSHIVHKFSAKAHY